MNYQNMPDEKVLKDIAISLEKKRLQKRVKVIDLARKGGFSTQTYSNFVNRDTDIKLSTLIQIMRALGELDRLESVFETKEIFNPIRASVKSIKRVRVTPGVINISSHEVGTTPEENEVKKFKGKKRATSFSSAAPLSELMKKFKNNES